MARASWSLPALVGVVGLVWIGYLGYDIWSTPETGRPSQSELATALSDAVTQRDADEFASLFTAADLPRAYAADYLRQVVPGSAATVRAAADPGGPLLSVQVRSSAGPSCTTWRVLTEGGRYRLSAAPALTAACSTG